MPTKCKVGFWRWLIKLPIVLLKGLIVDDPYGSAMMVGVFCAIIGFVLVLQERFGFFLGFKVVVIGLLIFAYGYYKGIVCEREEE